MSKILKNIKEKSFLDNTDNPRLKAYLSFDEISKAKLSSEEYYYINTKGNKVLCRKILTRNPDEVIVLTSDGVKVCLAETDLTKIP
jgi:hypothetical protein